MPHTIPDESEATYKRQAILYQTDWDTVINSLNGSSVISGCAVTAQGSPNMTVAVASGVVEIGSTRVTITGGNTGTISADSTYDKWVLVELTSGNTIALNVGSTSTLFPIMPAPTTGRIVIAGIYVPANTTSITNSLIRDMRVPKVAPIAHESSHESGASDALTGLVDANARVAFADSNGVVGTRRKLKITSSSIQAALSDDAANEQVVMNIDFPSFGSATIAGHSYSQLGGMGDNDPRGVESACWSHIVPAVLRIPDGEIRQWGRSSSVIGCAASSANNDQQGAGIFARHSYPNSWFQGDQVGRKITDMVTNATTTITSASADFKSSDIGKLIVGTNIPSNTRISSVTNTTTAVLTASATGSGSSLTAVYGSVKNSRPLPGLAVLMYGYNEIRMPEGTNYLNMHYRAYRHGITFTSSRLISKDVFDDLHPLVSYSGTWTAVTNDTIQTGPQYQQATAANATVTCKIPEWFQGGKMAVTFLGCTNTITSLGVAVNTAPASGTDETWTLAAGVYLGYVNLSNGDILQIENEQVLINSGAGTTSINVKRGQNGTSPATHANGTTITLPSSTARVDITSNTVSTISRTLTDGVTTNGSATITSATASFTTADINKTVVMTGIPVGSRIIKINSSTSADVSDNATATGSGLSLAIGTRCYLAGQGMGRNGNLGAARSRVHVTERFTLSRADAGKTITFTVQGVVGNEQVAFDSFAIEEQEANNVLWINQPIVVGPAFSEGSSSHTGINTTLSNALLAFGSNVKLVDVATDWNAKYVGTWQSATSTGTTVSFTPINPALCVIDIGSVLRTDAEEMLVTGIAYAGTGVRATSTNWTLTVTRAYSGVGGGVGLGSSGSAVNHTTSVYVSDQAPMSVDRVHPGNEGHLTIAASVLKTIATISQTSTQVATSSSLVGRRHPTYTNDQWIGPVASAIATTGSLTQNKEYAQKMYISKDVIAYNIACWVQTVGGAGSVVRMGIYADSNNSPGQRIIDAGTVQVSSGTGIKTIPIWEPLKAGWYWFSVCPQGSATTPVLRNIGAGNRLDVPYAFTSTSSEIFNTGGAYHGMSRSGSGGELISYGTGLFAANTTGGTPVIAIQVTVPEGD